MSLEENTPKLERMKGPWGHLRPHMKRNALFLVCPPVDLMTAAHAFKDDQSRVIMAWLKSGHILRPEDEMISEWAPDLELEFVIVQPFVLVAFKMGEGT